MKYLNAAQVLPRELLEQVQKYVDGAYLYIPRTAERKQKWGENTSIRAELRERNRAIYREHLSGISPQTLADRYYLSEKSIQRILKQMKHE